MSEYAVETRSYEPKNVFAGEFPTVTETGTAAAKIAAYTPVVINSDGEIAAAGAADVASVVGITATDADADAPVVYFMTGEFFADAITLPTGVTLDALKPALRKISIFLR